jgi:hypothetical protein
VGAYCKPIESKSSSTENKACSEPPAQGAVNWTLVNGNSAELGFPARSEITPGVFSSGYSPRTGYMVPGYVQRAQKWRGAVSPLTRTRFARLCGLREERFIEQCGENTDLCRGLGSS